VEETDQPLNLYFDENGFESKSLIKNLGSTFVYLVLYIFLCVPSVSHKFHRSKICSVIFHINSYRISRISNWLSKQLLWNAVFRFILQQGPSMMNAVGINAFGVFINFYHPIDEIQWIGAWYILSNFNSHRSWPSDCYWFIHKDPLAAKEARHFGQP
jgi:hypothetical protein